MRVYIVTSVMIDSLSPYGPTRLLCWHPPGKKMVWVAMSFSRGSSWPRDQTSVSYTPVLAGGFFTTSATWEALWSLKVLQKCHTGQQHPSDHPHSRVGASALSGPGFPYPSQDCLPDVGTSCLPVAQRPQPLALTLLFAVSRIVDFRAFLYPQHQDITVVSFRAGISLLRVFLKHCGILHGFCDHIHLLPLPKKSAFHINSGHQYFDTALFSQPIPWIRPYLFSFAVRTPSTISVFLCTTSLGIFLPWLLQVLELSVELFHSY